ncbi:MAG: hypothetical protein OEZ34_02740 [Spirochaetia bacterium]|nr:hypothetical protein [Spirochaetia bacterium]
MSRTLRYKIIYFLLIVILAAPVLYIYIALGKNLYFLISMAVVFLIPGRIQGYLFRNFFTGRKLMAKQRYKEALEYFFIFLDELKKNPRLKYGIYLAGFIFSNSIHAMTYNNIGAACIDLGDTSKAEKYLKSALEFDDLAPLPYFNLAIVYMIEKNEQEAQNAFRRSEELGYTGSSFDKIIQKAGEIYARAEG